MNGYNIGKNRFFRVVHILIAAVFIAGYLHAEPSQEMKIDLNALINDTQIMSDDVDRMCMVWWIPVEFWRVSLEQDPAMTKSEIDEIVKIMDSYINVVVIDGKIGVLGAVTYKSEADVRSSVKIKDSKGTFYHPLNKEKIDADAKTMLSMMKPFLVNMLGAMGENMHFILFPSKNKKGKKLLDAKREGTFSVFLNEEEFRWRLPLGSLLPPKICRRCGEKLSGAFKYCPWDGNKLPK